jgi:hypothetical protein
MATFTLEQYNAIVAAIASGEMVVAYNGKRVEYRSMAELMQAKAMIEADLVAAGVLAAPGAASGLRRGSTTLASYCGD